MVSKAKTVAAYLRELDPDQRRVIAAVRDAVNRNLPKGYEEAMTYGMIAWQVPLDEFPDTYNGEPLCYAGLAAQKNHNALYLMRPYGDPAQAAYLKEEFSKRGKKLDMGKSCVRFKTLDDLPLDVIGKVIKSTKPRDWIAIYKQSRNSKDS